MRITEAGVLGAAVLGVCIAGMGCNNKLLDPSQVGRFRPTPAINVILDSLGVAEETPVPWQAAEDPQPSDIVSEQGDYMLCKGDVIRVSIFELYAENQMVTNQYIVNESGKVSIPDVGVVQAAGMTETQFEESIRRILSPNILKNPSVNVAMLNSEQRTYSVIGDGVAAPGRHIIPRNDFRLTDALAIAGGPRQFNVSNIFISRPVRSGQTAQAMPSTQAMEGQSLQDMTPAIREGVGRATRTAVTSQAPASQARSNHSIASERALVGMIPPTPGSPWGQGPAKADLSMDFPKAYGLSGSSEVISPASFERVDAAGQRSKAVSDTGASRQAGRSASQPDAGIDWAFREGRWVPVAATGQDPVSTQWGPQNSSQGQGPANRMAEPYSQSAAAGRSSAPGSAQSPFSTADDGAENGSVEWVFRNGRWVPVITPGPAPAKPQPDVQAPSVTRPSQRPESAPRTESPLRPSYDPGRTQVPSGIPAGPAAEGGVEWVFREGRWVPVPRAGSETPSNQAPQFGPSDQVLPLDGPGPRTAEGMTWEEAVRSRLIRIPTDKLWAGDPRYNVVIQPGDAIHVPVDIVGECCIMGNVTRAGYINITGRPMTLKMAIAAAGGLGPLAYPKKCEVVRRIGDKREEIVLVDLDRIASGEQPDFFIKPNDLINVGTHFTSRWRAVLRNAFRATYGFGFVYDRNFGDAEYGTGWPQWISHWF
jgi:protein involved in polysaccharide export with SLBB domain